jgi:hypothetical protein
MSRNYKPFISNFPSQGNSMASRDDMLTGIVMTFCVKCFLHGHY